MKQEPFGRIKPNEDPLLDKFTNSEYKYGFTTDIETESFRRGLDEDRSEERRVGKE